MNMKWLLLLIPATLALAVVLIVGSMRTGNSGEIRDLAKSGASADQMIAIVEKSPARYTLTAEEIIKLKADGVPDEVVIKMIEHKPQ